MKAKHLPTDYRKYGDEELVYRYVQKQDVQAIYQLFGRYGHLVFGVALLTKANVDQAQSFTQQLFANIFTAHLGYQKQSFPDWLFAYTKNETGQAPPPEPEDPLADLFPARPLSAASFDEAQAASACMSLRQFQQYLNRNLAEEEATALQRHVTSCSLCTEALRGASQHRQEALAVLEHWNHKFLKDQNAVARAQLPYNKHSTPQSAPPTAVQRLLGGRSRAGLRKVRSAVIASLVVAGLGGAWLWRFGQERPATINPVSEQPKTINIPPSSIVTEDNQPKEPAKPTITPPTKPIIQNAAIKEVGLVKTEPTLDQPPLLKNAAREPADDLQPAPTTDNSDEHKQRNTPTDTAPLDAYQLYEDGKFAAAVAAFKVEMKTAEDPKVKFGAALMAARCYINLGQYAKAKPLLEVVESEATGSQKRTARRLLRRLDSE